jgi:hypothetical protein
MEMGHLELQCSKCHKYNMRTSRMSGTMSSGIPPLKKIITPEAGSSFAMRFPECLVRSRRDRKYGFWICTYVEPVHS